MRKTTIRKVKIRKITMRKIKIRKIKLRKIKIRKISDDKSRIYIYLRSLDQWPGLSPEGPIPYIRSVRCCFRFAIHIFLLTKTDPSLLYVRSLKYFGGNTVLRFKYGS